MARPGATSRLARHIKMNRGSASAYFTRVLRDLKMAESDRSAHELEVLLNTLEVCWSGEAAQRGEHLLNGALLQEDPAVPAVAALGDC